MAKRMLKASRKEVISLYFLPWLHRYIMPRLGAQVNIMYILGCLGDSQQVTLSQWLQCGWMCRMFDMPNTERNSMKYELLTHLVCCIKRLSNMMAEKRLVDKYCVTILLI